MKIYRVEDAEGNGPYGWGNRGYMEKFPDNDDGHPTDAEDGIGYRRGNSFEDSGWRFGFSSLEQAGQWFDAPRRRALADAGYSLRAFEVEPDRVLSGTRQVAFLVAHSVALGGVSWVP